MKIPMVKKKISLIMTLTVVYERSLNLHYNSLPVASPLRGT